MRPALTRSPVYVLSLVAGVLTAAAGWTTATLFDQTIAAVAADLHDLMRLFPQWIESLPAVVATGGTVAGVALVHAWLIGHRRFRRLALADVAFVAALGASTAVGALLRAALDPSTRSLFEDRAATLVGHAPTSPTTAGLVAVVVMVRQWLPVRIRSAVYGGALLIVAAHLAVAGTPPYLGILLDVGVGMTVSSAVALALRTPNLQPDRAALVQGLAESGLDVAELHSADVDARGSEPWFGSTVDGQAVFVKALSTDQRAADLLFRAVRWVRLRRTGDAPPEVSLRRAVEHEALVAHHARSLGVATPRPLAVANVGHNKVALAYERVVGRSLDKVPGPSVTDDVIRALWEQVRILRHHRIAHRDLRLANMFLSDAGDVLLIDFSFAELAASQQLLDTDVAEVLAATSTVVGPDRAALLAAECLGIETLEQARDWLHPLALSTATRQLVAADGRLERLRGAVNDLTGHTIVDYEPLGRLSPSHVLGLVLSGVGAYSLLALVVHEEIADHIAHIRWPLLAAAIGVGLAAPLLGALSYRAGIGRRAGLRPLVAAALAAQTPVIAPTTWSFANRILSDAARDEGLNAVTAKRAASDRCLVTLASAPLLVAGFVAAGSRFHGQLVGVGTGLVAGALVALAEAAVIGLTPPGRELTRVWLRPFRSRGGPLDALAGTAAWSAAMVTAQGVSFALAARAAGVDTRPELLIALGMTANVLASLVPAPAGVGAVELLSGAGLLAGNSLTLAALGAVLGRVALFWIPLPFALWAYRSTRYHRNRSRRAGRHDPLAPPVVPAGDRASTPATDRSWWT